MKRESRLLYLKTKKNPNKKWWQFWKDDYIEKKYTIKVNKKGELVLGDKI